jgi:hypothetical protein
LSCSIVFPSTESRKQKLPDRLRFQRFRGTFFGETSDKTNVWHAQREAMGVVGGEQDPETEATPTGLQAKPALRT